MSLLSLLIGSVPFVASATVAGASSRRLIYSQKPAHWLLPIISDVTVAFSTIVAELVLCEIGDWSSPDTRYVLWKLSISVLLTQLVLVIPLAVICVLIVAPKNASRVQFAAVAIIYSLYLVFLGALSKFIPLDRVATSPLDISAPQMAVACIGFVGVTAMALLSGLSTVSAPFTVFASKQRPVNQSDMDRIDSAITTTSGLIQSKRSSLQTLRLKLSHRLSTSTTNLMIKVLTSLRGGDDLSAEVKALQTEITSLETMRDDLTADLESLRTRHKSQIDAKTLKGQIRSRLYSIFAIYCIYRLVNILLINNPLMPLRPLLFHKTHLADDSSETSDALVVTIAHILQLANPTADIDALSRQVGFAVSGLLLLASLSSVVTTFNTLLKAFPFLHSSRSHSLATQSQSPLTGLVVSQILGTYVISTSLLLRSNLPAHMSSAITSALGAPLKVESVQSWSEAVIFTTVILVMVALYIATSYRADEAYFDEESAMESKFD